jgi:predicted O-methyltransferase YrrM
MKPLLSVKEFYFDGEGFGVDLQGWHSDAPLFAELIAKVNPKVIIECGTWKGASAAHMASLSTAKIYCVDTWLGGIDHVMQEEEPPNGLMRKFGYPQLYYQFLKNINAFKFADRIYPVPQSSINGAKVLAAHNVSADLIYIDGSHEINDVYADIRAFWGLLAPGGIMFGDDTMFIGVLCDVHRFAEEMGMLPEMRDDNFWVLKKTR